MCFLVSLFAAFSPLLGEQSIEFSNGPEGQHRRKIHDREFTQAKIVDKFPMIQQVITNIIIIVLLIYYFIYLVFGAPKGDNSAIFTQHLCKLLANGNCIYHI